MAERGPLSAHLLGWDNGVGLSRDLRLLASTLRARGYQVDRTDSHQRGGMPGAVQRWRNRAHAARCARLLRSGRPLPYDFVLMEEHVVREFVDDAPHRVLLPHPEWFLPEDLALLPRVGLVLVKTHEAARVFSGLGCRVAYVGFTSEDRMDRAVQRTRTFFHLAGLSRAKNTDRLLALWRRHPEWPCLTVVQDPNEARPGPAAANIEHLIRYLPEAELKTLQNRHRFHLCPSETEGFGHYIVEAMSVGAVVITLDAPPMNEMITPERGVLLPYARTGTRCLATTYQFDDADMEAAIKRALALSDVRCDALGAAARAWYESERAAFAGRLDGVLRGMLTGAPVGRAGATTAHGAARTAAP